MSAADEQVRPLTASLPDFGAPSGHSIADELTRAAALDSAAHQADLDRQRAGELAAARADGVADGMAQAGIDATRTWQQVSTALAGSHTAVRDAVRDSLAVDAAAIVDIAHTLAAWVIGRELKADPAAMLEQVQHVLDTVAAGTAVEVAVHPDALADYTRWAGGHADHDVTVVPDPSVPAGEAVARTAAGGISRVGAVDALRRAVATLTDTAASTADTPAGSTL